MAEILEKVSVGCFVLAIALAVIALVLWFRLDLFRGVKERRRTALQRKKKKQLTGKN